jgi:uncharacterized protein
MAVAIESPSERRRPRQTWQRRMLVWFGVLAVLYAAWCTLLYLKQDDMMFPRSLTGPAAAGAPAGVESMWIDGDGGTTRVEAWYVPPPRLEGRAPLVVFLHGNGELIDHGLDAAAAWRERGYAVLLPEYRGYGRSGGRPSEKHIVADVLRFVEMTAGRPEIDPARVVLHGRSLGGAVAAQIAERRPVSAVIVESTFTSATAFAARFLAPPFLVKNPFRTERSLAKFGGRTLILHGAEDEIIPVAHGRRLHAALKGSTYAELPGRHNDFPADADAYWRAIDAFLSVP